MRIGCPTLARCGRDLESGWRMWDVPAVWREIASDLTTVPTERRGHLPHEERPADGEDEAIRGIIEAMTRQSQIVAERQRHAVRASHAKSTGLVTGELVVAAGLPELAQRLFANGERHTVAIRFAQGPGQTLDDRVSTHRGMAIEVFGVKGQKLPAHQADTQDLVPASGLVFPSGTAQGVMRDERQLERAPSLPEAAKSAVSSSVRNVNRALQADGTQGARAAFFDHPFSHPLSEPHYSQAPIRYGDHVAKLAAFPASAELAALAGLTLDVGDDPDAFRAAVVGFFRDHHAEFEIRAQLRTNADTQPFEDASVKWAEAGSLYRTVATPTIPAKDAYSPERRRNFDEVMAFRPGDALAAHRSMGSAMRARLQVYGALSAFRHGANGTHEEEPADPARIPT